MKTKLINGTRTPDVIYQELKKFGKLEGVVSTPNSWIRYEYFTTPKFGEGLPAMEVTIDSSSNKAIATRKLDEAALKYLLPGRVDPIQDIKFGGF